jgi:hypothetical protein
VHIKSCGRCVSTIGCTFEIFWPNQQFKLTVASRVQLTWLSIGLVQMIKLSLWDLFRWLHDENYQRRSLTAVR